MNLLEVKRNKVTRGVGNKHFLFYGDPGTRKTSVASLFPDSLILATEIGYKGQKEAVERHNKNTIINSLIKLYKELCHSNGKNPTEDSLEREFSSSPSRS